LMKYRIEFLDAATKDLKKIDGSVARRVLETIIEKLSQDPKQPGQPLKGKVTGFWRLRVGDYRVVYRILEDKVLVLVVKVGHRKSVYRELFSRVQQMKSKVNSIQEEN
jgi:mRNA interferase RelE/StbE